MFDLSEQPAKSRLTWSELKDADDTVLMEQVVDIGNDDAFEIIVRRYERLLFTIALRFVHDRSEAQDAVQIAFVDAYRARRLFDSSKGSLKTWLMRYVYTRSINRYYQLQQQKYYTSLDVDEIQPLAYATGRSTEHGVQDFEAAEYVTKVLARLKPKQREAIELIAIHGMTLQDAADKVGDSLAKLRHNYYRGLEKLQSLLTNQRGDQQAVNEQSSEKAEQSRWQVQYVRARSTRTI